MTEQSVGTGRLLVESLASFDPIDRFDALFGHWWNRPFWRAKNPRRVFFENLMWQGHKRFAIPRAGDTSGYEAEIFLRNRGIYVWGRGFDLDNVYFNVKKEQAAWAEYLLMREGITTANTVVDERNQVWAARYDKAPPGWGSNKRAMIDWVVSIFAFDVAPMMRYRRRGRNWPRQQKKQQSMKFRAKRGTGARGRGEARRPIPPRRPDRPRRK